MKKLYFKKLTSIIVYTLICIAVYLIGFSLISLIANFFKVLIIRTIISFGIPLIIILIRIYNKRLENPDLRREYLASVKEGKLSLKEEWQYIIKFPHFLAELLAFSTLAFAYSLLTVIGVPVPFIIKILSILLAFLIFAGLYFIINFLHWVFVHRTWKKEY